MSPKLANVHNVISDLELHGCQRIGVASRDKYTVLIVTDTKTQFRTTRLPLQLRHKILETVTMLDKLLKTDFLKQTTEMHKILQLTSVGLTKIGLVNASSMQSKIIW
jgi:hypothetical protein